MGQCKFCGNSFEIAFSVRMGGQDYDFDSYDCAINALAPHCPRCGNKMVGHGDQSVGAVFCCSHCFREAVSRQQMT